MFRPPPRISLRQRNVARRLILWMLFAFNAALCIPTSAQSPTPGQNVNMVSGFTWPYGDPFLERQNEPSLAVSTRNPLHLLGGANDYRTVDLTCWKLSPAKSTHVPQERRRVRERLSLGLDSTSPRTAACIGRARCCPGSRKTLHPKDWLRRCMGSPLLLTLWFGPEQMACFTTRASLSIAAQTMA